MAPLSKQLSGVILLHDAFHNHLDSQGRTIDEELEKKNFASAGETLASILSEMVIDKHPVVAEYIHPTVSSKIVKETNENWYVTHVRESQYLL